MAGFTIVAELVFEQAAMLGARKLAGQLDIVSVNAQKAIENITALGKSYALSFLGGGGVLGLLGKAIDASNKFARSQGDIANLVYAHRKFFPGIDSFNDALSFADDTLKNIIDQSRQWGLNADDFARMVKVVTPALSPKGLAGNDLKMPIDIARGLLKSAGVLGITPWQVESQVLDIIGGATGKHSTLFRRLVTDAPQPFEAAGMKGMEEAVKKFNKLDPAKRVNLLNESLKIFSNNVEANTWQANTLNGILERLSTTFSGMGSILKPIGDSLMKGLVGPANKIIDYLNTQGTHAFKIIGNMIDRMVIDTPEKMFLNFKQLSTLSSDFKKALNVGGIVFIIMHINESFKILGKTVRFVGKWLNFGMFAGLRLLPNKISLSLILMYKEIIKVVDKMKVAMVKGYTWAIDRINILSVSKTGVGADILGKAILMPFKKVFNAIKFLFVGKGLLGTLFRFATWLGVITFFFQVLSRTAAKIKWRRLQTNIQNMPRYVEMADKFTHALQLALNPFQSMIDKLSDFGAKLDHTNRIFIWFINVLDTLSNVTLNFMKLLYGLYEGPLEFLKNLIKEFLDEFFNMLERLARLRNEGLSVGLLNEVFMPITHAFSNFDKILDRAAIKAFGKTPWFSAEEAKKRETQENIVNNNIGKIEINQDFKERYEPDRVAFSIKEVIEKAYMFPNQANNKNIGQGKAAGLAGI